MTSSLRHREMNCYLDSADDEVACTRIRTNEGTTLLIDVRGKDTRRPDEYYKETDREFQDPEILYSVKDVSNIEQGGGGFVNAVKARHEVIAKEQATLVRRDSILNNKDLTDRLAAFAVSSNIETKPGIVRPKPLRNFTPTSSGRNSGRNSGHNSGRNSIVDTSSGLSSPRRTSYSDVTAAEERLMRADSSASSTSDEVAVMTTKALDFIRAESEIIYSLTDVTDVEQGQGGFVQSLKKRHESLGTENEPSPPRRTTVRSRTEPFPV